MTMPVVAFLEARIAEEEKDALKALKIDAGDPMPKDAEYDYSMDVFGWESFADAAQTKVVTTWWPGRVLAEVEAKRAAIEHFKSMDWSCEPYGEHLYAAQFLVIMASVYKDHPDHQEDWGIRD